MTTTNEKPQCGFCGGTEFGCIEGGPRSGLMWVVCKNCDMWKLLRKTDAFVDADEEPNRSAAIDRYVAHTERLAMQILKNDAEVAK